MQHANPVLLSAFLFAGVAEAQPTIDQSNFAASPGESFVLNASTWMDPGASGANVTWDFSGLVIDSTFTYAYVDPASTPMTDSFPTATVAHAEGSGYAYRSFDATGGYYLGYNIDPDWVVDYQDPEMTFQFPCTYGTQWVDDLFADVGPGPSWYYTGSINAEADGHGTLILPYGTFTNVLRLHLTRSYTLETPWPEDGFYVDTIYYYLHPGTHYPLVEVFTNTSGATDGGDPIVTAGARWLSDPFAGIQGAVAPANTLAAVAQGDGLVRLDVVLTTGGAATIDVIDAAGRRAAQERMALSARASSHTLSVSTLRPGLYSVRLLLNGQQMTTRLVMP